MELEPRARAARRADSLCVDRPFTALVLQWRQSGPGEIKARVATSSAPGRWGASEELHDDADVANRVRPPDGGLRTSGLLWTGEARCARVIMRMPSGTRVWDSRALLIDSSAPPHSVATRPRPARALRPGIVTREEWRANESLRNCPPAYARRIKAGFVHHTAGSNSYSRSESDDVVRAIYLYHASIRGWCDVGYNFLVDRFGTVYEGRSGGMSLPVIPAAQAGFNRGAFAVAVMGNFEQSRPPRPARKALKRLLAWRLDVAHLPAEGRTRMVSTGGSTTRYPAGTRVRLRVINGHRRTGYTACPGDRLARLLPRLRPAVARIGEPKILRPRATSYSLTPGSDGVVLRARATQELDWAITVTRRDEVITNVARSGLRFRLRWRAIDQAGEPLEPGRYVVTIAGATAEGEEARPAQLTVRVRRG